MSAQSCQQRRGLAGLFTRKDIGDVAETTQNADDFDPISHRTIEDDVIADGKAPEGFGEFISGAANAGLCGQRLKLAHKFINEAVGSDRVVRSDV